MMKLITWEMDRSHAPSDPAERMKLAMSHCEMVKKGIESGRTKMWGINPGGNHGFSVTDADENEIFAMIAQYIPHVKFKVESMLDIDEVIASLKAAQEQA
jgi:hypothetical protein